MHIKVIDTKKTMCRSRYREKEMYEEKEEEEEEERSSVVVDM